MDIARFLAIPFADRGRSFEGADCWGLVWLWYRALGVTLTAFDEIDPSERRRIREVIAEQERSWLVVEEPKPNDVAVMRGAAGRGEGHLGIVMPRRMVLHTSETLGPHLDRISDLKHRILYFRRHPSLA